MANRTNTAPGGRASGRALTPAQRREKARTAALARWHPTAEQIAQRRGRLAYFWTRVGENLTGGGDLA